MKGIEGKELEMYWLQTHYIHVLILIKMSKQQQREQTRNVKVSKTKIIAYSNPRSDDALLATVQSVKTSFYNVVCKFS